MTYPQITKSLKRPDTIFLLSVPISGLKALWFEAIWLPWISFSHGAMLQGYLFRLDVNQAFQVLFSPKMGQIISLSLITDPAPSHLRFINSSVIKTLSEEPSLSEVYCNENSL